MMPMILACVTAFGLGLGAVAFLRDHAAMFVVLAVCGATMVVGTALCNTSIQQRVPYALRGRVLSMYTFAFYAFLPFGSLFAGIVAEHRGLAPAMLGMSGGLLAAAMLSARLTARAPAPAPEYG
jgi:MFS family permease